MNTHTLSIDLAHEYQLPHPFFHIRKRMWQQTFTSESIKRDEEVQKKCSSNKGVSYCKVEKIKAESNASVFTLISLQETIL
jgi:hypothetical protein